jgi:hypothetical protein
MMGIVLVVVLGGAFVANMLVCAIAVILTIKESMQSK